MGSLLRFVGVPVAAVLCCGLPFAGNELQASLTGGPAVSVTDGAGIYGGAPTCQTYPVATFPVCQISRVDTCPGSNNCSGLCPYDCTINVDQSVLRSGTSGFGYNGGPFNCPGTTVQACLSGLFTCYCGGVNVPKVCGATYNSFVYS